MVVISLSFIIVIRWTATFKDFDSRRCEDTRRVYGSTVRGMLGDPDAFAERARSDRKAAEDELMKRIVGMRGKLSPASVNGMVGSAK